MDDHHRPHPPPPPYVTLSQQEGGLPFRPPPHRRNVPRYHTHRSSGCCSCKRCCCCFLLLCFIILIAIAVYIFVIVKPRPPSYSIDDLSIGDFNFNVTDLTIRTKFLLTVRFKNPNDMIGIRYKDGSSVVVLYRKTSLCSGHLPSFYQGHRNTTVMQVALEGRNKLGTGIHEALQENQRTGRIPLGVFVRVPVSLRFFNMDSRKVTVNVACALVVDGLSPNKDIGIKSADYKVDVDL